jgi:hypothetical protein
MKTKTTQIMKTQLTIAFWSIVMLFSFAVHSQTHIYNEGASSGITFTNNGSQVTNPVSDAVNSSANCAQSGTVAVGEGIHYLPSGGYTPVAGARLYFSVYNPGNTMYGQVKFEYSGAPNVLNNGGDIYYVPGSVSGWVEYSISLTPNLGNTISKILLYPSGNSAVAVFVDNIYFHTSSIYSTSSTHFFKDAVENGSIVNVGVAVVNNPLPVDPINSSIKCLKTDGTGGGLTPPIDVVNHIFYPGIPVYTATMGKYGYTELNSAWKIGKSPSVSASSRILRTGYDSQLKISFDNFSVASDYVEWVVAIFGSLTNRVAVPNELLANVKGISFRAKSYDVPVELSVQALDIYGNVLSTEKFAVIKDEMKSYNFVFNTLNFHHLSFKIKRDEQNDANFITGAITIDDVYLTNNDIKSFQPPADDVAFLKWIKESSLRYFLWQYRVVGINGTQGTVLEHYEDDNKVSLSGIGYAYSAFILAAHQGMISESTAKQRISSILKWQQAQNWFNGSQGKFGFPLHYYNVNGTGKFANNPSSVSTIDWAMCAAGIRVVRQKYNSDSEIVAICDELLGRPQWNEVIANDSNNTHELGRIIKGLNASTGVKSAGVWADAYSEETELIYLETLASGKVNTLNLTRIYRQKKDGQFVSWFGCGFTYNWLQLWTGVQEPYQSTSILAYQKDAITSNAKFGLPLMGLTACTTLNLSAPMDSNGFIKWDSYISNQGSSVSGAPSSEVSQINPAPYGAALALPFQRASSITALREFVKQGFYHPLLGLPDSVRINELPAGIEKPIPNWNPFDINIGPIALAIEQTQQNTIGILYLRDNQITTNLTKLKSSIPTN